MAVGAAVFWAVVNPALSLKAFASVLIVACPCALALAAPFALGTAQRALARRNVFLKKSLRARNPGAGGRRGVRQDRHAYRGGGGERDVVGASPSPRPQDNLVLKQIASF